MHALIEISRFVAQVSIAGLWQGLVLISTVTLLLRLVPNLSAAARYAIWWCAFALGILIPLLHLPASAVLPLQTASAQWHIGTGWGVAIAAIWAVFMIARAAQLLVQVIHLHRIWKRAKPVSSDARISELLRTVAPSAQLCTSDDVESPSVIGFFLPRLLIPASLFTKLAPSELEQIVLHEAEHLRRRDDWGNLLQKVLLVLFPLNPALFWIDRRLSLERELACDAGVIASTKSPFDYAHCLTRLAEHRLLHRRVALSLSAWGRRSELVQRVHHLLKPSGRISRIRTGVTSALICIGLIIGGVGMAASPRMLSFTDAPTPVAQSSDIETVSTTARPIPVIYRPTANVHPVLLKASVTHRKAHRSVHKAVPQTQLRNVRAAATKRSQPRLILTTFTLQTNESNGARSVSPHFSPAYAAVRFEDGWLVIQL
jgi:beta-lactamase regulating signal transducer with metallopeptidase domain